MARVEWEFTEDEIFRIEEIIATQLENPFVKRRRERNVIPKEIGIDEPDFWNAHLIAQLTSQQRSGPDSSVSQFVKNEIHTIGLTQCRETNNTKRLVSTVLEDYGGIRYYNKIGEACQKNLDLLDSGGWSKLWGDFSRLIENRRREPQLSDHQIEREVSESLADGVFDEGLHRIGPKQSRNLLQILGLTRYEIPLDSRITKWLNSELNLPYNVTAGGLSNSEFYNFIMDIARDACVSADELPCIFDAAVFSSYDNNWTQNDAESIY